MKFFPLIALLALLLCPTGLLAKKTQSQRTEALSPQEQLKTFRLPEGYVIELVASEADGIINPIDLAFDDSGRLWTQTARMYPLDPGKDIGWNQLLKLMANPEEQKKYPEFKRIADLYQGKTKGEDKILILSSLYGDDKLKTSVFADGLTIPQSILPYRNGAFVAQGSEMLFLEDADGDGVADNRTPVLTGFGFTDTHTMAHTLVRGPGNWIHFSQGALNMGEVTAPKSGASTRFDYSKIGRFSIDGERVEVISSGLNNIWGFWMRPDGQWWGTEANDKGFSITPMEPGSGFSGIGGQRIRPYQPFMPVLHKFRVGGTGISGLAFCDDQSGSFPAQWDNVAFLANPITNTINAVRIQRNEDGSVSAVHLPDFLSCEDDWFRPVNIEFGPDGCLYIVDWYNKIVSHNEVPRTHPDRDKKHGRIWRIRHIQAEPRKVPDLQRATPTELLTHLSSPSAWQKRAALNQITDRGLESLAVPLVRLAGEPSAHEHTRIHALWALEGIHHYDAGLMKELLAAENSNLRREAVRALIKLAPNLQAFNSALEVTVEDPNPMVRSATLRAIRERGEANDHTIDILVTACKPELPGHSLGGPYERKFERYLARMALESFQTQLNGYFSSRRVRGQKDGNLLWASQALPEAQRRKVFLRIWGSKDPDQLLDESTFVILAKALGDPETAKIAATLLQHPVHGAKYVGYALKNQSQVQSRQLGAVLAPVLQRMLKNPEQRMRALEAIGRFKVALPSDDITRLLNDGMNPTLAAAVLKALQADPRGNQAAIKTLARNPIIPLDVRLSASHSYVQVAPRQGQPHLMELIAGMAADEKRLLTKEFSGSTQGAALLIGAHIKKALTVENFDVASAERISQFLKKNPTAVELLKQVRVLDSTHRKELAARLKYLMKVTDELEGNPETGKLLFNTCLMCHKVGEQGVDIAPPLDGSAHREKEALLTAILNPDAAMESSYQLYRVRKQDNTSLEGYRLKDDETGVTLAFMGGAKIFIPADEVASKEFVSGRSFMPTGLISGYSDQNVADLLSYIATLK